MSTNTRTPHGVGLTTRDGRYEVTSCEWDGNGSFHVEVEDRHPGDIRAALLAPAPGRARAARDLARRVDPMGKTRWTRCDKVSHGREGAILYRFTVSRLDPMYK